jgi:hypothetical protein
MEREQPHKRTGTNKGRRDRERIRTSGEGRRGRRREEHEDEKGRNKQATQQSRIEAGEDTGK